MPPSVAAAVDKDPHPLDDNTFRLAGDYWSMVFDGRVTSVRDSKGLRYLSRLLAEPGREFYVLDLVAFERASVGVDPAGRVVLFPIDGDAGELLDARAKAAYRRRLAEIDEDLAGAHAVGDMARAVQAEVERDILMRELSRAVKLGGRIRRAGSTGERARSAVTRAIPTPWLGSESTTPRWATTSIVRFVRALTACTYQTHNSP